MVGSRNGVAKSGLARSIVLAGRFESTGAVGRDRPLFRGDGLRRLPSSSPSTDRGVLPWVSDTAQPGGCTQRPGHSLGDFRPGQAYHRTPDSVGAWRGPIHVARLHTWNHTRDTMRQRVCVSFPWSHTRLRPFRFLLIADPQYSFSTPRGADGPTVADSLGKPSPKRSNARGFGERPTQIRWVSFCHRGSSPRPAGPSASSPTTTHFHRSGTLLLLSVPCPARNFAIANAVFNRRRPGNSPRRSATTALEVWVPHIAPDSNGEVDPERRCRSWTPTMCQTGADSPGANEKADLISRVDLSLCAQCVQQKKHEWVIFSSSETITCFPSAAHPHYPDPSAVVKSPWCFSSSGQANSPKMGYGARRFPHVSFTAGGEEGAILTFASPLVERKTGEKRCRHGESVTFRLDILDRIVQIGGASMKKARPKPGPTRNAREVMSPQHGRKHGCILSAQTRADSVLIPWNPSAEAFRQTVSTGSPVRAPRRVP